MSKILIITDAWLPQTNGVVTTLTNLVKQLEKNKNKVKVVKPDDCKFSFTIPVYKEIKLGFMSKKQAKQIVLSDKWDHIHIATPEGPLGTTFSKICNKLKITFTTSCHTKFPEFINARVPLIPTNLGWLWMRYKYRHASSILTTTESMVKELKDHGFTQPIKSWSRGVDRTTFTPDVDKRPLGKTLNIVCVSRVSQEKGLDDFCKLNIHNTKLTVVGDGPYRKELEKRYPHVKFVGKKLGKTLAKFYQDADVFVFPSKVDTFGVVIIEALATGTPVAAYPVTGPNDIIEQGVNGFLHNDLTHAVTECLKLDREKVYNSSKHWTWENCYLQFIDFLK